MRNKKSPIPSIGSITTNNDAENYTDFLLEKIRRTYNTIKSESIGKRDKKINFSKVASSSVREGFYNGNSVERLIIYLRSFGCAWALKPDGGCLMCGHYLGTSIGKKIEPSFFINQFKEEIAKYDFSSIPILCVYNAGSFLNSEEIPIQARHEIWKVISEISEIKSVIVESRPEFIDRQLIEEIDHFLPDKNIEIGVGLECSSDLYRKLCINKGFTLDEYKRCAEIVSNSRINLLTYITIKPLFLTTEESISEAIASINTAVSLGSSIVSLEPTSIQDGTMVEYMYEKGLFKVPWGWDVIEVVKKSHSTSYELRIGGFEFFPPPKIGVHNCPDCNSSLYKAISDYNKTGDINNISKLDCTCKHEWFDQIKKEKNQKIDFLPRVNNMLEALI